MQNRKPTILLPEGSETYVGFFMALVVWLWTNSQEWPALAQIVSIPLIYFAGWYTIAIITEDSRLYVKSLKILRTEIQPAIILVEPYVQKIKDVNEREMVSQALLTVDQILSELPRKRYGVMYSGYSEVSTQLKRLVGLLPEYIDITLHPAKAGRSYVEAIENGKKGLAGFGDWADGMVKRVNNDDLFNMTTNAMLLGSLRNLLGTQKDQRGKKDEQ